MTPPRRPGFWSRRTPLQQIGLIVAALVLPCLGGLTVIGALTDAPKTETVTGTGTNLADVLPIETSAAAADPAGAGPAANPAAADPGATTGIEPPPTAKPAAQVTKKLVTAQAKIPFKTRRVDDSSLAKGKTRIRTPGVNGIRTVTYEVTLTDGKQTARRIIRTTTTRPPVTKVIAVGTKVASTGQCDPNYSGCVPIASDVDCAGGSGNGPAYVKGPIRVIGDDIYDLDRDGDGIACDS
ncbi:G5 domain-containing protein [Actinoplanes bogorensis]|uniref:G5 domain-containing protein n=2 Tax=Paractinoplanes bogorensis TaxID=1610840 RepID=A0ABS5Z273_9ACTN|nr:G5 domain-containing protein [Actinoplanes bogorensis]